MKKISFRHDVLPLKDVLYRLALRITLNHEEAQDVVQDTLIKVWNRRDEWSGIESIEAYSLTICRNLSLDRMKNKAMHSESLDSIPLETPDQGSSPYEQMLQKDRLDLVRRMVNTLPEKQRSCMQLRDFEGWTINTSNNCWNATGCARPLWRKSASCARFSVRRTFPSG